MIQALKTVISLETSKVFSMHISDENVIAVVYLNGIRTIELDSSCEKNQKIRERFIPNNSEIPLLQCLKTKVKDVLWNLNLDEVKEVVAKDTFFLGRNNNTNPYVISCQFSRLHNEVSYLAALTNLGSLDVYKWIFNDWTKVSDVAKIWLEHCSTSWCETKSWDDLKAQHEKGMFVTFTWVSYKDDLFIVIALKNGDVVILMNETGPCETLKIVSHQELELKDLSSIHAFEKDDRVVLCCGFYSGEVTVVTFRLPHWEVAENICVWSEKDLLPPIMSSKVYQGLPRLIASKTYFIVLSTFGDSVSSVEKYFDWPIVNVCPMEDSLIVAMDNYTLVKLSAPDLKEIDVWTDSQKEHKLQAQAISKNGAVYVSALVHSFIKSIVTVSISSESEPLSEIEGVLPLRASLSKYSDILWVLKVKLLEDANIKLEHCPKSERLLYWYYHFRKMQGKLKESEKLQLESVTRSLAEASLENCPETLSILRADSSSQSCLLCSASLTQNNVKSTTCSNMHTIPRCSITFQPCLSPALAVCNICDAVATIQNQSYWMRSCPFCGGSYRLENEIIS